jgi:hypothetical protein
MPETAVLDLLHELRSQGVRLAVVGDRLRGRGVITAAQRERLQQYKAEVLALLAGQASAPSREQPLPDRCDAARCGRALLLPRDERAGGWCLQHNARAAGLLLAADARYPRLVLRQGTTLAGGREGWCTFMRTATDENVALAEAALGALPAPAEEQQPMAEEPPTPAPPPGADAASSSPAVQARAAAAPPRERTPSGSAVLAAEGLWRVPVGELEPRGVRLREQPRTVGELFTAAEVRGLQQLFVHRSWLEANGLPTTIPPAPATLEAGDDRPHGLPHPLAEDCGCWNVRPSGELYWWLHGWNEARPEGQRPAYDVVIPAYNTDGGEWKAWPAAPDGRTLARALAYFQRATGWTVQRSPGATGMRIVQETHEGPRTPMLVAPSALPEDAIFAVESRLSWHRPPTTEERQRKYLHGYDKNCQYLGAMSSLELGTGDAEERSGAAAVFDRTLPGLWRARVTLEPQPLLPERIPDAGTWSWYTADMLVYAQECGATVDVERAYVWPRRARYLRPFYETLRPAVLALGQDGEQFPEPLAARLARQAIKDVYTATYGWLAFERRRAREPRFYRPDWTAMIRLKARTNLLRTLDKCAAEGRYPVAMGMDCVYFLSDEPDPEAARPAAIRIGPGLGDFTVKNAAVPVTDALLALLDDRPGESAQPLQEHLNRLAIAEAP